MLNGELDFPFFPSHPSLANEAFILRYPSEVCLRNAEYLFNLSYILQEGLASPNRCVSLFPLLLLPSALSDEHNRIDPISISGMSRMASELMGAGGELVDVLDGEGG